MGFKIHLFFFLQGSSRGDEGVVDAFLGLLPITRSSRKPRTLPCRGGERRSGAFRAGGHCRGTLRGTLPEGPWLRTPFGAGPAPPPRRGPVSRQRGGRGRCPPRAAWAGGGEAGPEGARGPPLAFHGAAGPALPALPGPTQPCPAALWHEGASRAPPSGCSAPCTNVPSCFTSPLLTRANYASGSDGFPRSRSAW